MLNNEYFIVWICDICFCMRQVVMIKPLNTKHKPTHNIFQYLSCLVTKLIFSFFHWKHTLEDYKCFWNTKSKGTRKKKQEEKEEDSNILFPNFWRESSRPFLVSNAISSSFLVRFEWYWNHWVHQLRIVFQIQWNNNQRI